MVKYEVLISPFKVNFEVCWSLLYKIISPINALRENNALNGHADNGVYKCVTVIFIELATCSHI